MKTAIILAAGVGSRLRPLTDTRPKCCVQVGNTSIIRRIVHQLQTISPKMPVYIAVGYMANVVREELADLNSTIKFVENVDFATTNNMESCRIALEARSHGGSSLIINADCMYDDSIITKMVASKGNAIAADTSVYIDENMKVRLNDGRIEHISKCIEAGSDVATSVDLYSFEAEQLAALLAIMQSYREAGNLNQWTEVAIDALLKQAPVKMVDVSGSHWIEIDNYEDLTRAKKLFSI